MRRWATTAFAVALSLSCFAAPAYAEEGSAAPSDYVDADSTDATEQSAIDDEAETLLQPDSVASTDSSDVVPEDIDTALEEVTPTHEEPSTTDNAVQPAVEGEELPPSADDRPDQLDEHETQLSESSQAKQTNDVTSVVSLESSKGAVTASGSTATVTSSANTLTSFWQAINHDDGTISYRNASTGLWLSPAQQAARAGVAVNTSGGTEFLWRLHGTQNNRVSLAPATDDTLRLEVADSAQGVLLRLAKALEGSAQSFLITTHDALTEAATRGVIVDEGIVTIAPSIAPNKAMDVKGGSKANGANVQIYDANSSLAQKWELSYQQNGLYQLRAAGSGKVLDVKAGGVKAGTNVQQYAANSTLAQLWYLVENGSGYALRSAKSGMTLELAGESTANGANLQIGTPNGSAKQCFSITRTALLENSAVYTLKAGHATSLNIVATNKNAELGTGTDYLKTYWRVVEDGTGFFLQNLAGGTLSISGTAKSGANVLCGTERTKWVARIAPNGGVILRPLGTPSLVLDIAGAGKKTGTNVRLWSANGTAAQSFELGFFAPLTEAIRLGEKVKAGVMNIVSALDRSKTLDVKAGSSANAANVQIYTANNSPAQKWELLPAGNNLFMLRAANSGRVLDVRAGSTASGANVQQYADNSTLAQYWYLIPSGSNGFSIRSAKSGLALDIAGGKSANGTNVQIYKPNGTSAQRFLLSETQLVSNGSHVIGSKISLPLVLSVTGGSKDNGANIELGHGQGANFQNFKFTYVGDGLYTIQSLNGGRYLEVSGGSKSNGGNVVLGTTDAKSAQRWFVHVSKTGGVTFENEASGLYLDVAGAKKRFGVNVQQYAGNDSTAQDFTINNISWFFGDEIVRIARTQLGARYSYEPSAYYPNVAFNCSGLAWWCYHTAGYDISHSQGYYSSYSNKNDSMMWQVYSSGNWKTKVEDLVPGDLVFFSTTHDIWHTEHVGIYIGNGEMIDASYDGVKVRSVARSTFVGGGFPLI